MQFLAVGTVRVGFNINGKDIICHAFHHANEGFTSTYMQTANLPVHYSIISLVDGSAGSMKAIGYSVASGGGVDPLGRLGFIEAQDITIANGDHELLVGMRLKADYYNAFVKTLSTEIIAIGKTNFQWYVSMNPTYTGTVTWIDKDNSAIQYAVNNGNDVTDIGIGITSGLASDKTRTAEGYIDNALRLAKKLDGTFIEIWLSLYAIEGDDYYAVLNYKDLF